MGTCQGGREESGRMKSHIASLTEGQGMRASPRKDTVTVSNISGVFTYKVDETTE